MNNIWTIAIFSTCLITLSIPLQIALFWGYNLYGHPWKRFLTEVQNSDKDILTEVISGDDLQGVIETDSVSISKQKSKTETDQKQEASKLNIIAKEVKSDNGVNKPTKHEGMTKTDQKPGASKRNLIATEVKSDKSVNEPNKLTIHKKLYLYNLYFPGSVTKHEEKTETDQKFGKSKQNDIPKEVKSENGVYEPTKIDATNEVKPVDETCSSLKNQSISLQ
jgi:hypothetical protein